MDEFETAKEYRIKANEVRAKAAQIKDPGIREMMLKIAVDYERMAKALEDIAETRNTNNRRPNKD
jgi:uncharacterized protein YwgA